MTMWMCNYFEIVFFFLAQYGLSTCIELIAVICSILVMAMSMPISLFFCFKVVSEFERAVIFRMGRLRFLYMMNINFLFKQFKPMFKNNLF